MAGRLFGTEEMSGSSPETSSETNAVEEYIQSGLIPLKTPSFTPFVVSICERGLMVRRRPSKP